MKLHGIVINMFQKHKKMRRNRSINISDAEYEYLLTQVRLLENMLEEKSKSVENAKSAFLKNLYHEIRTPLNAIVGFSNLIEFYESNEKDTASYLALIRESSQKFLDKIDNIVEASMIEAGIIKIEPEECNLFSLLSEMHAYFSIHKHLCEKDVAFLLTVPEELKDLNILCDTYRIKQVLMNLLLNAFKFTKKGIVEFGCHVVSNEIEFFVKDTGIGGLEGKDGIIFNPFSKLDESDSSSNGLGLGLSLAKGIADLMGGKIRFTSQIDKGSTFYFTVPYQPVTNWKAKNETKTYNKSDSSIKITSKGSVVFK
jgi:signal transduction histidine kinase